MMLGVLLFFFFSSRRRHTRWPRDWSSDVCSSDLQCFRRPWPRSTPAVHPETSHTDARKNCPWADRRATKSKPNRSEERRVGKECRSRGGPDHEEKKGRKRDTEPSRHESLIHAGLS